MELLRTLVGAGSVFQYGKELFGAKYKIEICDAGNVQVGFGRLTGDRVMLAQLNQNSKYILVLEDGLEVQIVVTGADGHGIEFRTIDTIPEV